MFWLLGDLLASFLWRQDDTETPGGLKPRRLFRALKNTFYFSGTRRRPAEEPTRLEDLPPPEWTLQSQEEMLQPEPEAPVQWSCGTSEAYWLVICCFIFFCFVWVSLVIQTPDQYTRTAVLPIFTLKQSKAPCDWGYWAFLCGA